MARQMCSEDWTARAEAYEEAADHLGMSWTDDVTERKQGNIVAEKLRENGKLCRYKAANSRGREE